MALLFVAGERGRHIAGQDMPGHCCCGIDWHVAVQGLVWALGARRYRCMGGTGRHTEGQARAFGEVGYSSAAGSGVLGTAPSLPWRHGAVCSRLGWARASRARYGTVYVGNVFVQNVSGLRKYVATQDMSDMSQTCHMTFLKCRATFAQINVD